MTFEQELFVYWVNARYDIYCRKNEEKPKPWSEDPIFQRVYFTNIKREWDKTTKYIRNYWIGPLHLLDTPDRWNLVPYLVFARLINRPVTLGHFATFPKGFPSTWTDYLKELRNGGDQIFSGAYLITTCGVKMDKLDYVSRVCKDVWNQGWGDNDIEDIRLEPYCQSWFRRLSKVSGLGTFLAAQVIADLKNTVGHPLASAPDWWTFVAAGPGSKRGLNYFFGWDPERAMSDDRFKGLLLQAREIVEPHLTDIPKLCNQDLQNCFCEFSKYVRVKNGGRTKRNYGGV